VVGTWREALHVVQPQTVIRWHRLGFRAFWNWKSDAGRNGRPPVDSEIARLVPHHGLRQSLWARRASMASFFKLGLDVSQRRLSAHASPCETALADLADLLENHVADLLEFDFFVVPTATFRVLYVS